MKAHVLNISKATKRRRDRFVVVEEADSFFSGVLILKFIPGEAEHYSAESSHVRARELSERKS
jgi:hypothetical protein